MRRKDKEIIDKSEIESIIHQSLVCRLALSDEEGPYVVPLCFGYRDNDLYFHSAGEGKKIEMLKRNSKVCFEFDIGAEIRKGETACDWGLKYKSVIGFGKASIIEDPQERRMALGIIADQYGDNAHDFSDALFKVTTLIKVEISSMTGKQAL
jgi:nitroimidazol reductase NimA-like FMN-containing flavoprotein (pyridoxamine 5'-phosphate oxidase superfamily)